MNYTFAIATVCYVIFSESKRFLIIILIIVILAFDHDVDLASCPYIYEASLTCRLQCEKVVQNQAAVLAIFNDSK